MQTDLPTIVLCSRAVSPRSTRIAIHASSMMMRMRTPDVSNQVMSRSIS